MNDSPFGGRQKNGSISRISSDFPKRSIRSSSGQISRSPQSRSVRYGSVNQSAPGRPCRAPVSFARMASDVQ